MRDEENKIGAIMMVECMTRLPWLADVQIHLFFATVRNVRRPIQTLHALTR